MACLSSDLTCNVHIVLYATFNYQHVNIWIFKMCFMLYYLLQKWKMEKKNMGGKKARKHLSESIILIMGHRDTLCSYWGWRSVSSLSFICGSLTLYCWWGEFGENCPPVKPTPCFCFISDVTVFWAHCEYILTTLEQRIIFGFVSHFCSHFHPNKTLAPPSSHNFNFYSEHGTWNTLSQHFQRECFMEICTDKGTFSW